MGKSEFEYSEAFLQWIWENLLFDFSRLKLTCGKTLKIIEPGTLNSTDGPDFKQAVLEVEDVTWYGDVEIHVQSNSWNAHGHQKDRGFNSVVLHVVADDDPKEIHTENDSTPFTLNIRPYLSPQLRLFLKAFKEPDGLACSSGFSFISEEVFRKQIEKAHLEYFEKKSNDFLQFYDPELLPSKAWKYALILSLWDGLGISHNREAMQLTARRLLKEWSGNSIERGIKAAFQIGGFGDSDSDIKWNLKSVRPANHPKQRIKEAVKVTSMILNEPFEHLLSKHSTKVWKKWLKDLGLQNSSRFKILYGTVFLPSTYVLGNLFAHQSLSQEALSEWKSLKTPIPHTLLKSFKSLGINPSLYRKKLGAIHQLKSYCKPVRCSECFILKNAIES